MEISEEFLISLGFQKSNRPKSKWGPDVEFLFSYYGKPSLRITCGGISGKDRWYMERSVGKHDPTIQDLILEMLAYCKQGTSEELKQSVLKNIENSLFLT